jgi:hypothetical protein
VPGYFAQLAFLLGIAYGAGWAYYWLIERRFLNRQERLESVDVASDRPSIAIESA